jgi:hypothetical protein
VGGASFLERPAYPTPDQYRQVGQNAGQYIKVISVKVLFSIRGSCELLEGKHLDDNPSALQHHASGSQTAGKI